jgi:hypothetical protein
MVVQNYHAVSPRGRSIPHVAAGTNESQAQEVQNGGDTAPRLLD